MLNQKHILYNLCVKSQGIHVNKLLSIIVLVEVTVSWLITAIGLLFFVHIFTLYIFYKFFVSFFVS